MKEGFLKSDKNDIRNDNYRNRDGIYIKIANVTGTFFVQT